LISFKKCNKNRPGIVATIIQFSPVFFCLQGSNLGLNLVDAQSSNKILIEKFENQDNFFARNTELVQIPKSKQQLSTTHSNAIQFPKEGKQSGQVSRYFSRKVGA
jgi:hypothetical protein